MIVNGTEEKTYTIIDIEKFETNIFNFFSCCKIKKKNSVAVDWISEVANVKIVTFSQ